MTLPDDVVPGTPRAELPADLSEVPELLEVTCPRCASVVTTSFYGPCEDCRLHLRAAVGGEAREVGAAAYEPKVNVTPNAVALRD